MGLHDTETHANKVVIKGVAFAEERSIKTFSSQAKAAQFCQLCLQDRLEVNLSVNGGWVMRWGVLTV